MSVNWPEVNEEENVALVEPPEDVESVTVFGGLAIHWKEEIFVKPEILYVAVEPTQTGDNPWIVPVTGIVYPLTE
jgi:hypothetical protein